MTSILDSETGAALTQDAFLGGRVRAWQPVGGFRAGIDSVLLAAACPAKAGDSVLELGCGAGVAALCLAARVPCEVTGLELQPDYAALAARNGLDVVTGDVAAMPDALRQRQFHHVIFNPPYFAAGQGDAAPDAGRQTARAETVPIAQWFAAAEKRLRAKGMVTVIQRAERLPDMLSALGSVFGGVDVLPLAPRAGRAARLVILRARKDSRAPFRLHPPLVLHDGAAHERDAPDYTAQVQAVLERGAALPFPD
ncbi:MAG: methyltransferase [Pseudomonadota bacterium]